MSATPRKKSYYKAKYPLIDTIGKHHLLHNEPNMSLLMEVQLQEASNRQFPMILMSRTLNQSRKLQPRIPVIRLLNRIEDIYLCP